MPKPTTTPKGADHRSKPRRDRGSGSVYRDKHRPKRWIGETRIDGKRHRVYGPTKTDVQGKLAHSR
ncbi:MAG: hypothetical protein R2716_00265 [Microthrixaceae bacterium]